MLNIYTFLLLILTVFVKCNNIFIIIANYIRGSEDYNLFEILKRLSNIPPDGGICAETSISEGILYYNLGSIKSELIYNGLYYSKIDKYFGSEYDILLFTINTTYTIQYFDTLENSGKALLTMKEATLYSENKEGNQMIDTVLKKYCNIEIIDGTLINIYK